MSGSAPEPRPSVSSRPIWIFSGASFICNCWMSVFTATNSTPVMPASIIRSVAFRPAPPTPTTRMTARYAESARGACHSRGGCSGKGSTSRAAGRASSSGAGWVAGSGSRRGASTTTGSSAAGGSSGSGRCGSGCSGSGSGSGTASACGSSCPSAWRWAASVARKSSASGPSRMLARLRAIEHLLREIAVGLRSGAGGVVLEHRRPLHGRFGIADGLADPGLEDEVAEVLLEDLERLPRVERPAVVHRREDPLDPDVRIQVLADHAERVLELDETAEREVLALDGHDHAVGRDQRVDRQQAQRRRRVDDDEVVAVEHRLERLLQGALAPDHRGERELGAGQVDRRDREVDLAAVDDLLDREPVDE